MISYGDDVLGDLAGLRESKLPNETGGILLGIADMSRKSIHIAYALPQPLDSEGTKTGFERGVVGVLDEVNRVVESSMHQLRYVGEWHSHPRQPSAWPSVIDLSQLAWLDSELAIEGLPGLMAIAADDGNYSIILSRKLAMRKRGVTRSQLSELPGFRPAQPTMMNLKHAAKAHGYRIISARKHGGTVYRFARKLKSVRAA